MPGRLSKSVSRLSFDTASPVFAFEPILVSHGHGHTLHNRALQPGLGLEGLQQSIKTRVALVAPPYHSWTSISASR